MSFFLGNDVVDLRQAALESNTRRPGWKEKIFLESERFLIGGDAGNERLVWTLWSMKEAAWKITRQMGAARLFNPFAFECSLEASPDAGIHKGEVRFGNSRFATRSCQQAGYVHTIACQYRQLFDHVACIDLRIADVRDPAPACFKDESGHPFIRSTRTGESLPVSISHHGRFHFLVLPLT